MKEIPLTQGKVALVDDNDYGIVSKHKWYCHHGYAVGWVEKKKILMHRFIMKAKPTDEVDHRNGNRIDNRRENLRFCNRSQNKANVGPNSNNKAGYKGVYWSKPHKKYRAKIGVMGKNISLGLFIDPKEAALAYNEAAKKYFGEFAGLNNL
jgi:hypothetical protein